MLTRVVVVMIIIMSGSLMMSLINNLSIVDGLYLAVASATSIGYGDLGMTRHPVGRWLIICYVVVAVVSLAMLFHSFCVLWMEYEHKKKVEATVNEGVTLKMLRSMDHDHDGEVTRDEFLCFLLIKLAKVNPKLIDKLNDLFDEADVDENGMLDLNDIRLHQQMRGRY